MSRKEISIKSIPSGGVCGSSSGLLIRADNNNIYVCSTKNTDTDRDLSHSPTYASSYSPIYTPTYGSYYSTPYLQQYPPRQVISNPIASTVTDLSRGINDLSRYISNIPQQVQSTVEDIGEWVRDIPQNIGRALPTSNIPTSSNMLSSRNP